MWDVRWGPTEGTERGKNKRGEDYSWLFEEGNGSWENMYQELVTDINLIG